MGAARRVGRGREGRVTKVMCGSRGSGTSAVGGPHDALTIKKRGPGASFDGMLKGLARKERAIVAKKLTVEEQGMVVRLAKVLAKISYGPVRSNASGISSGLVRLRKDPLTPADIDSVLDRYGCAGPTSRSTLGRAGVLVAAGESGGFHLALPKGESAKKAQDTQAQPTAAKGAAKSDAPSAKASAGARGADAQAAASRDAGSQQPAAKRSRERTGSQAGQSRTEPRSLLGPGPRTLAEVPRVVQHTPEATDLRCKILDLDPRLWINGWLLSFPEAYELFEDKMRSLDRALVGSPTLGDGTLTCRQLSYQVFGDEKFLEQDGDGRKLLERMGLRDIVRHRPQPRLGLLHHVPRKRPHMRIVVTENLDPWLDIRELMYADGRRLILGERVEGVVFGNGYLVDDARRLPEFIDSLGCDDVEVLYWGDIDRAGLQIYDRLRRVAEGRFELRPFVAAYVAMVHRARERFADPLDNEASAQEGVPFDGLEAFCNELPEDVRDYVRGVISGKRLLPQEILTKADL